MLSRNLGTGLLLSVAVLMAGCAGTSNKEVKSEQTVASAALPEKIPFPFKGELHRDNALVGHFWSAKDDRLVSWREVFANLPEGGWLLLGEAHDTRDHQNLESMFIQVIARSGRLGNVAFEQLNEDQQSLVDPWIGRGNEVNGHFIGWDPNAWSWSTYINPLSNALNAAQRVVAINPSNERIMQTYKGQHPVEQGDAEHTRLMSELIRIGHCNMLPEKAVAPMVKVQLAKDQFMARTLADSAVEGRVGVAIMGYQHARKDYGVPLWLKGNTDTVTVLLQAVSDDENVDSYIRHRYGKALPADYILFTPGEPKGDYCEQLSKTDFSRMAGHEQSRK
ncbi:ChaN family lipoprotein [Marinobacterium marinum]|uniref:ChaN family lipoprotein n=1 Tax=Marinobacterium marinum TaxID=2756129 RepID=A0A7W1WX50_9GAMM|nr:ChaN family lipoprotein [Marinobacterium marinum]MBA4501754.1 ChaN family lipoprotein [Marinobacterium marinum]